MDSRWAAAPAEGQRLVACASCTSTRGGAWRRPVPCQLSRDSIRLRSSQSASLGSVRVPRERLVRARGSSSGACAGPSISTRLPLAYDL